MVPSSEISCRRTLYHKSSTIVSSYATSHGSILRATWTAIQMPRCLAAGPSRPLSSIHGSRSTHPLISHRYFKFPARAPTHRQCFGVDAILDQGYAERQRAAVQMCVLFVDGGCQLTRLGPRGGRRTSRREISESMSITSRAAWRLDVNSTLGILLGGALGSWRLDNCCLHVVIR